MYSSLRTVQCVQWELVGTVILNNRGFSSNPDTAKGCNSAKGITSPENTLPPTP